jgi:UTP--glucose-1-phosphate uridylyltransferase
MRVRTRKNEVIHVSSFEQLRARYLSGELSFSRNRLGRPVAPLEPGDVHQLSERSAEDRLRLERLGLEALASGQVGVVILAGGMATRFKYDRPKALYPILGDRTFLDLKLDWILERWPGLPVHVMTSFHTHVPIDEALASSRWQGGVSLFQQGRMPRLRLDGQPLDAASGSESHATPGHGEWLEAFRRAGLLERFMAAGGRTLCFSNVDNLGATLDPLIIGRHLESGHGMTVEVARKQPGDKGGAPARVGGRVELVEGFMFPEAFDQDQLPYFNTASYCFDATQLRGEVSLPWYVVEKEASGERVIQFEQLAGDLSSVLATGLIAVERDARFIPVKSQGDVPSARELLKAKQRAEALS